MADSDLTPPDAAGVSIPSRNIVPKSSSSIPFSIFRMSGEILEVREGIPTASVLDSIHLLGLFIRDLTDQQAAAISEGDCDETGPSEAVANALVFMTRILSALTESVLPLRGGAPEEEVSHG